MGLKRLVALCADVRYPRGGCYVIRHRLVQVVVVAVAMSCLVGHASASDSAATYAPVDRHGPALSVPQRALDRAIACDQDPATAKRDVILVIPPWLWIRKRPTAGTISQLFGARGGRTAR
jgi:hypothetical protein